MAMVDRAGGIVASGEAGQPLASSGMTMLQVIAGTGDAREKSPASPGFRLDGPREAQALRPAWSLQGLRLLFLLFLAA